MKTPGGLVLGAGQTWKVPCGVIFLSVAPVEPDTTFDMQLAGGNILAGIKVPFTYSFPVALESKTADPWNIIAGTGPVNIFYVT